MKRLGSPTSRSRRKKNKVVDNNGEVDGNSELPEPILHRILSLLPTKDAIKTSALSKAWYSAFNSFPVLDFDQNDYCPGIYRHHDTLGQGFYDYVHSSIASRCKNINIKRFNVFVNNRRPCFKSPYIDEDLQSWINHALSKNVEHLALDYSTNFGSMYSQYKLPTSALFRANMSLKVLDLCGFSIVAEEESVDSITDHPNIISGCYFSSLKRLKLAKIRMDEQILQRLLSNTCFLEEVSIDDCQGFRSVSLCSTKLKSVELNFHRRDVERITFEAPNLQRLSLGGVRADVLHSILEASSKSYAKTLTKLVLRGASIDDAIFRLILGFGRELEKLTLNKCRLVESVRISSCQRISKPAVRNHNVELVADCLDCNGKNNGMNIFMPVENGLNKLIIE